MSEERYVRGNVLQKHLLGHVTGQSVLLVRDLHTCSYASHGNPAESAGWMEASVARFPLGWKHVMWDSRAVETI